MTEIAEDDVLDRIRALEKRVEALEEAFRRERDGGLSDYLTTQGFR